MSAIKRPYSGQSTGQWTPNTYMGPSWSGYLGGSFLNPNSEGGVGTEYWDLTLRLKIRQLLAAGQMVIYHTYGTMYMQIAWWTTACFPDTGIIRYSGKWAVRAGTGIYVPYYGSNGVFSGVGVWDGDSLWHPWTGGGTIHFNHGTTGYLSVGNNTYPSFPPLTM